MKRPQIRVGQLERAAKNTTLISDVTIYRVAMVYGVPVEAVLDSGRQPLLVEARRIIMQLLYEQGVGVTEIGRIMHRDHSTVIHHLHVVQRHSSVEEKTMLADIRQLLAKKAS